MTAVMSKEHERDDDCKSKAECGRAQANQQTPAREFGGRRCQRKAYPFVILIQIHFHYDIA
jgi:hypothetical protein